MADLLAAFDAEEKRLTEELKQVRAAREVASRITGGSVARVGRPRGVVGSNAAHAETMQLLATRGPMRAADVAAARGVDYLAAYRALRNHPTHFSQPEGKGGQWTLTAEGRKAAGLPDVAATPEATGAVA